MNNLAIFINNKRRATPPRASYSTSSAASSPPRPPQRALGVDYGRKFIGIAVSTLGIAPRPLANIRGGGLEVLMQIAQEVVGMAVTEGCDAIVIGLPVTSTGSIRRRQTDSQQGRRCRNFADVVTMLSSSKGLDVYIVDERGTTMEAEALVWVVGGNRDEQKRKKDGVAAALILSAFFADPSAAVKLRPLKVINNPRQGQKAARGSGNGNQAVAAAAGVWGPGSETESGASILQENYLNENSNEASNGPL